MCNDDSCDLNHCRECRCHTVGNELIAGLCQYCFDIEEQLYIKYERNRWLLEEKKQI